MIKTKPAMHIKKNDHVVFRSATSKIPQTFVVSKVEEWDMDQDMVKITIPPTYMKVGDQRFEVSKQSTVVLSKNEQVEYEVKK